MPPVREASMNPTAATVLPAPVACSNQKRRLAPGSSGASATTSSSSVSGSSQSWGSSSSGSSTSSSGASSATAPLPFESSAGGSPFVRAPLAPLVRPACAEPSSSVTIAASVPESASTWWSVSSAPSRSFGFSTSSSRSSPSSSE